MPYPIANALAGFVSNQPPMAASMFVVWGVQRVGVMVASDLPGVYWAPAPEGGAQKVAGLCEGFMVVWVDHAAENKCSGAAAV